MIAYNTMADKRISETECPQTIYFTDDMARAVLDALSAHIAIINADGSIIEANRAWREYALENGMPADYNPLGRNYLSICDTAGTEGEQDARKAAAGIRKVIAGKIGEFLMDYPCHGPGGKHWYYMRATRMPGSKPHRVVVSHEDITALKKAEAALIDSQTALTERTQSLEETNIALKVLLRQREQDKSDLEQKVLANLKNLVLPYVERLKRSHLKARDKEAVSIVGAHLSDILSPLLQRLSSMDVVLTPQEIQVANFVTDGRSSKEIADILSVSETTIHFHRKNLRKKFGLSNTRTNLRSYLMSLK